MKRSAVRWAVVLLGLGHGVAAAHGWYPPECCSGKDCHPVPCDTLVSTRIGVTYTPKHTVFPHDAVRASHDRDCHICTSGQDGAGVPYCVFTLQSF